MRKLTMLVVVGLLLGLVAVPVSAGHDRPFKAKANLVSSSEPTFIDLCGDPDVGFLGVREVWTGTATHLGRFYEHTTLCLDLSGVPPFEPQPQGPPLIPFKVYGEFVAANGDTVSFEVENGVFNPLTCEITNGGFEVTGGTGRFDGAQGSGMTAFVRDEECNASALRHTGKLSY